MLHLACAVITWRATGLLKFGLSVALVLVTGTDYE